MRFRIFKNQNIIQGVSDISFGSMRGSRKNKRAVRFLKSLGHKVKSVSIVWAEQDFSGKVHICGLKDSGKTIKGVDGLMTSVPGRILAVVVADCLPILIFDPKNKTIACLHGGAKCLKKGIIKKAIREMSSAFGAKPKDILVGIGPHIRKCHYNWDLTKFAVNDFLKLGVKKENIEDSRICTFCQYKKYFSYTRVKRRGRDEGKPRRGQTSAIRKRKASPGIYKEEKSRFAAFIGLLQ